MNKQISDYTLKELQEHCISMESYDSCKSCEFRDGANGCAVRKIFGDTATDHYNPPFKWNLNVKSRKEALDKFLEEVSYPRPSVVNDLHYIKEWAFNTNAQKQDALFSLCSACYEYGYKQRELND